MDNTICKLEKLLSCLFSALTMMFFIVSCNDNVLPEKSFDEDGASYSEFSVADGKTVHFSKGNLQRVDGEWRFAEHQYDYFGNVDCNNVDTGDGDLFRWREYRGDAIINGGNRIGMWRELSSNEWHFLLEERKASKIGNVKNGRFAKANVIGNNGLIIFPDNYSHPKDVAIPRIVNNSEATYTNVYKQEDWEKMEKAGAIFLPAAGVRIDEVIVAGKNGGYWASDVRGSDLLYLFYFCDTRLSTSDYDVKKWGHSVRLVMDI